jgi:hypothetical protein
MRDYRDIVAGGLLIAGGLWVGIYASSAYSLGTVAHMGPGMFPAALGYILAGLGAAVALPALFRPGTVPRPDYRQFFAVIAAVLLFALTADAAGMVPAICLMTFAAVLADNKLGVAGALILAAGLSLLGVLIFRLGLGIPLVPFRWPF